MECFAFAILDEAEGTLFLARDRVGVKPLYYATVEDGLVFASEAKALFQHPRVEARLDKDNLFHFLGFRSLPAPRTLFRSVRKLAAGEWASIKLASGRLSAASYWSPLRALRASTRFDDACDELHALLDDSVEHRLQADVPVSVLLSGGLDSGFLLSVASERCSEVSSFTASYPGHPQFDESAPARAVARRAGSRHHEVPIDESTFSEHLADVAYFQDEPIAAPVCVPVYLLARQANAASVSVALTGEGSDELFMGYHKLALPAEAAAMGSSAAGSARSACPPLCGGRRLRRDSRVCTLTGRVCPRRARAAVVLGRRHGLLGAGQARHPRPRDGRTPS